MEGRIVQLEDGKNYREIPRLDGSFEYVPIADVNVHLQQTNDHSHEDFFRNQKQKAKRVGLMTQAIEQAAQRVSPGAHAGVRVVKDEEFFRLNKMYQDAYAKGEHRQCDFQPLSAYQHKLSANIRPILAGEIGVYGTEILTLEPGYGTGQLVQVPAQLEAKNVSGIESGGQESTAPSSGERVQEGGDVQRGADEVPDAANRDDSDA